MTLRSGDHRPIPRSLPQCSAASNVFGKQADVSIASADESFTGIHRKPQLKRTRRFISMSAAMPISSADAKECHPEDRLPPVKFQRAIQQTSAWSNLVKVSTTTSFEGAKDVLCFIDPS